MNCYVFLLQADAAAASGIIWQFVAGGGDQDRNAASNEILSTPIAQDWCTPFHRATDSKWWIPAPPNYSNPNNWATEAFDSSWIPVDIT